MSYLKGEFMDIFDDNFEETGHLTFRIDSVQAVPEPVRQ